MKCLVVFSLSVLCFSAWAAEDWKVVAVSSNCEEKILVLAKEGEKFVYLISGELKIKLASSDGHPYSEESPQSLTFKNKEYTFMKPSMVDPNPSLLEVHSSGIKSNCKMKNR
jgi:hypothetical protein